MAKFSGISFPTSNVSAGDDFYNTSNGVTYIFKGGDASNISNWEIDNSGGNVPSVYSGPDGTQPAGVQEGSIFIITN